jgi:hypothetical protein
VGCHLASFVSVFVCVSAIVFCVRSSKCIGSPSSYMESLLASFSFLVFFSVDFAKVSESNVASERGNKWGVWASVRGSKVG